MRRAYIAEHPAPGCAPALCNSHTFGCYLCTSTRHCSVLVHNAQVPVTTNCVLQGITPVANPKDCSRACLVRPQPPPFRPSFPWSCGSALRVALGLVLTQVILLACPTMQALGFEYTGMRARDNVTGCFVLTDGRYKNNCNFNTNTRAHCEPPCTLEGSPAQNLCVRK